MGRIEQVRNRFPKQLKKAIKVSDTIIPNNYKFLLWIARELDNGEPLEKVRTLLSNFVQYKDKLPKKIYINTHQINWNLNFCLLIKQASEKKRK